MSKENKREINDNNVRLQSNKDEFISDKYFCCNADKHTDVIDKSCYHKNKFNTD